MTNVSKKPLNVKSIRFESADTEPTKVEKGMLIQVVESGKYYEYNGKAWIKIEPKEALKKWEDRQSSCVSRLWKTRLNRKYQTTKAECLKQIEKINGVCSGCGGKITPIETVDNAGSPTYWGHCEKCSVFCWGTSEKIFKIARKLVEEHNFIPYSSMQESEFEKPKEKREYWLCEQTRGAISIVAQVLNINKELT